MKAEKGVFEGKLVVELASVLAGPAVGMFFAELGARIIKVENPATGGDVTRSWKLASEQNPAIPAAYFCAVNWGKESILLNLADSHDRPLLLSLIRKADFLITSFRSGAAEKLGLGTDFLLEINPGLVIGEINGYGPNNPRAAYDAIVQAETGFYFLNGNPGAQTKMPVALIDILAAHQLKEAMLVAYIRRMNSGKGGVVRVSLLDTALASLANQATNWLVAGHDPQPMGSQHPNIVPYGASFDTQGGKPIVLAVGSDQQFLALCRVMGLDPPGEFSTNAQRVKHRIAVKEWLQPAIANWEREKLLPELERAGVPAGAIHAVSEALALPEASRIMLENGGLKAIRTFVSDVGENILLMPPPLPGQHQQQVTDEFRLD